MKEQNLKSFFCHIVNKMDILANGVKEIHEQFITEYFVVEPYCNYITSCGLSMPEIAYTGPLKEGEPPKAPVISVNLSQPFPDGVSVPERYKGLRVLVKVVGHVTPLVLYRNK